VRVEANRAKRARHGLVHTHTWPARAGKNGSYRIRLVGGAAEEANDDSGGDPIAVLMKSGTRRAKSRPVEVGIEQTNVNVPGRVDIDSAADFVGEAVNRNLVAAGPGDGGV